jgi:hypothetical protein
VHALHDAMLLELPAAIPLCYGLLFQPWDSITNREILLGVLIAFHCCGFSDVERLAERILRMLRYVIPHHGRTRVHGTLEDS